MITLRTALTALAGFEQPATASQLAEAVGIVESDDAAHLIGLLHFAERKGRVVRLDHADRPCTWRFTRGGLAWLNTTSGAPAERIVCAHRLAADRELTPSAEDSSVVAPPATPQAAPRATPRKPVATGTPELAAAFGITVDGELVMVDGPFQILPLRSPERRAMRALITRLISR